MKSTTVGAIFSAIKSQTDVPTDEIFIKRKYRKHKNGKIVKWHFVVRADENILQQLDKAWSIIHQQTEWELFPLLKYPDTRPVGVPLLQTKVV